MQERLITSSEKIAKNPLFLLIHRAFKNKKLKKKVKFLKSSIK